MISARITPSLKNGNEPFHVNKENQPVILADFWRWYVSDLISNATRGVLAEFIVALALEIPIKAVRREWSAYDLLTAEGIKVEVKSAAYIQSWDQREYSKITFSVRKSRAWSLETNQQEAISRRQADVYVFALLAHRDKQTIDPLNLAQWEFYVLPTVVLDHRKRSQYSIMLNSLSKLCRAVPFEGVRSEVLDAARINGEGINSIPIELLNQIQS